MSDIEIKQVKDGELAASFSQLPDNESYTIASRHETDVVQAASLYTVFPNNTTPSGFPSVSSNTLDIAPNYMGTIKNFSLWEGTNISDSGLVDVNGGPFTPLVLFSNGEEGVWYEPSPTTTFISTANLTPCAPGDACGFLLDKSKGVEYVNGSFTGTGPELVLNGDFSNTNLVETNWIISSLTAAEVVEGKANVTPLDSNVRRISQAVPTVVGKYYKWEFDYVKNTANRLWITAGSSIGSDNAFFREVFSPSGKLSVIFKAVSSTTYLSLGVLGTNSTGEFDNVTFCELPGNHATQATAAARPILRQSGSLYYLEFDGVDDYIAASYASPLSQPQTAIVGATPFQTTGIMVGSIASSGNTRQLLYDNIYVFARTQFDAGNITNGIPYILTPVWNSTSSGLRINGSVAVSSGNVGGNTRDGESIGAYGNGNSQHKNMHYFGHVSINRLLAADEIDNTEAYLAEKSGVTL